ncbi:MAG: NADH-quinone oxidoreductase subunit L [Actinobacteria bacterium]|nr:NADH-quinone oxidoreductase subunit L [Actinomycetota bacterium]
MTSGDFGQLAPLIIALPLLGALALFFFGRRIGTAAGTVASATIGAAFVIGVVTFFELLGHEHGHRSSVVELWEWVAAGSFRVGVDLLIDELSMVMVLVVTGVGTLIHVYSIGYMHDDPRYPTFFAYLNLFAASMLLLVLAENVLLLYVGWEGVGLCSYLLIGFWFERPAAANAAKKAFIVNRIGDLSFLIGILVLTTTVGALSVGQINAEAGAISAGMATVAALLLFGGATGKSAQIPLYVWLPDAMEGPTPVSALIHAATMVTAGVYMVARLSPVFEASSGDLALTIVAWVGAATALFAAVMACAENDIKRVLAYSTISQLGYMFLAHGVHAYSAGIFHLATHAFFKALMFLGAGAVMHALAGETDLRKMGGLRRVMPVVGWTFAAGWLAISGVIPFAGFFSKDAILASAWADGEYGLWAVGVLTALLTAFYMSRLYFSVFEGDLVVPEGVHVHDAPVTMATALVPLGVLSVVGGVLNLPGVLTLEHFLEPAVGESHVPEGLIPWVLAGLALFVAALGIGLGWRLYARRDGEARRRAWQRRVPWLVTGARNKFYVDEYYGGLVVGPAKRTATFFADVFDTRVIDGVANGAGWVVARSAAGLRKMQTGYVRNYGLVYLFGVVLVFSLLIMKAVR